MGNRISKVTTKTGDNGTTSLSGKTRVSKADIIIDAIGTIDELNCSIGLARVVVCKNLDLDKQLKQLQHELFNCGGDLCLQDSILITQKHIAALENQLEYYNSQLKPLKDFVLPTGSEVTARIHMARCICRRAERVVVKASEYHEFNPLITVYLNRMSDWMFVAARYCDETDEEIWDNRSS